MFTVLVMYMCLQGTMANCESKEVWVAGTWTGESAMADCQKERTRAYNEIRAKPSAVPITFECEYDEST